MAGGNRAGKRRRSGARSSRSRRSRLLLLVFVLVALTALVSFALPRLPRLPLLHGPAPTSSPALARRLLRAEAHANPTWKRLRVKVLATHPHDPQAFTQGLLWYKGSLYESTGLRGRSTLREVDPDSGKVEREQELPRRIFGEGLARVGDHLVQLTWQARRAYLWKLDPFTRLRTFRYQGEGWGLCFDGKRLVMSDGSSNLTFRDPETFARLGRVGVTLGGKPLASLNELECVDGKVYANVWQTQIIVRIDPATGVVDEEIDASGLLTPDEQRGADVLNGIAYDPVTRHFWITGKLWPKMFEVVWTPS